MAFLLFTAEINNKDTVKVCRKITKITEIWDFFLAMEWIRGWNSWQNFKNYRFLSIEIACYGQLSLRKITDFCPSVWKIVPSYISSNQAMSDWKLAIEQPKWKNHFRLLSCLQSSTRHSDYHFWVLTRLFLVHSVDKESLKKNNLKTMTERGCACFSISHFSNGPSLITEFFHHNFLETM